MMPQGYQADAKIYNLTLQNSRLEAEVERLKAANLQWWYLLEDACKLLKHGKRVVYRQGWERGMTTAEWEEKADLFIGDIAERRKVGAIDAARKVTRHD